MPAGRPTIKTPELIAELLGRVANGESVKDVTDDAHMPHEGTVYAWAKEDQEFSESLKRAHEQEAHCIVNSSAALEQKVLSGEIGYNEFRVVAQSRQWRASKFNRAAYGDHTTIGGDGNAPLMVKSTIDLRVLSTEQREALEALLKT